MNGTSRRGSIMLIALVFGSVFFVVLAGIAGYALSTVRLERAKEAQLQAFSVAEAGLEYYRWHLAHFPNDLQNGTALPGPYAVAIPDPMGGTAGTAELSINAASACGRTTSIGITSVGTSAADANFPVTLSARYARPSVGLYSYILNDSVWAGADRVINGPYHSNGGIHMDGTANAPVTSSQTDWNCDATYGCSPVQTHAAGVVGSGTNQNLWKQGVPQVDFAAIAADFSSLKATAQSSGLYFPRYSSGTSGNASYWRGYHLIFNANGTVTVKRVSASTALSVTPVNAADPTTDRSRISSETTFGTYPLSQDCGLIFVEDHVWIEGAVPSKVTVVAANVTNPGVSPNAYLRGNILYQATDGSDGLTLIAQNDVLVSADSPADMTLNGIFIAQNGAFGRNLYSCPSAYEPRGTLTIRGTTVSNKRTGTKWMGVPFCGTAGYQTRVDAYDRALSTDPPPFTPNVSTDYQLVEWRQQ